MFKYFFTKSDGAKEHLSKERLLRLVDGELSTKDSSKTREHLETCWNCRSDLEMVEETISEFMDFRKRIQLPLAPPPPRGWGGFSSSMERIREELDAPKKTGLRLSDASPFQIRLGIGAISILLIAALIVQLVIIRPVSASELFDKASDHQNQRLSTTSQPVVYQRFRGKVDGKELNWEIWFDATSQRVRRSGGNSVSDLRELGELNSALVRNHIDPNRPLAAESIRTWHESLRLKSDEVIYEDSLTLKTTNLGPVDEGEIRHATLKFRSNDYHPFESTYAISTSSGDMSLTITEVAFELISLARLEPNFFDSSTGLPTTTGKKEARPEGSPEVAVTENSNSAVPVPESSRVAILATADLEIEVLRLLSSASADMGDEINVKRENGLLYVRGLVESTIRRDEILDALKTVRQDPAVRIELETVAEVLARKKQPTGTPTSVDTLETDSLTTAVENELTQHFGSEAEARRFSSRVVSRSGQAMSRVYALRRLAKQFSAAEIKELSPEARSKWLALIRAHANSFSIDCDALSRELGSAFGSASVSGSAGVPVDSVDDLARAIESLFQIASANDRSIRSALTLSAGGSKFSALKSNEFWRSLKSADALAARIASIR